MHVRVQLVSGHELTYPFVEEVITHEDVLELLFETGSVSLPLNRMNFWEVQNY